MKALRNLRLIAAALLLLVLIGMTGFHFIEGWTWFDGLYMVVTTFTTIAYQEIHPLSHAGRIFNLALIVSGVSLVFLGIGSLTQALLEFELASFLRKALAIKREQGMRFNPSPEDRIEPGDYLIAMGETTPSARTDGSGTLMKSVINSWCGDGAMPRPAERSSAVKDPIDPV